MAYVNICIKALEIFSHDVISSFIASLLDAQLAMFIQTFDVVVYEGLSRVTEKQVQQKYCTYLQPPKPSIREVATKTWTIPVHVIMNN
jgi:hypothetical protein